MKFVLCLFFTPKLGKHFLIMFIYSKIKSELNTIDLGYLDKMSIILNTMLYQNSKIHFLQHPSINCLISI